MQPQAANVRIVVVDDEPANVMLLERMLEAWGYSNVMGTTDPTEVEDLFRSWHPDLLMLDLMMPRLDGFGVMERLEPWIRGDDRVPVVVLTADATLETRRRALASGARDFLTKPFDAEEVRLRVANLLELRSLQLQLVEHNATLEHRVRARTRDLEHTRLEMLDRLALAAEYRDDATQEHAQRVGRTVALLAEALGVADEQVDLLRHGATLHDIGKIGISDALLLKPGSLTEDEFELMKTHTVIGAQILGGSRSGTLDLAGQIAESHHERWDGRGYPNALSGPDIPLSGRLTSVADVFDALTHRRPYKAAWPVEAAVAEVVGGRATQFDPEVVDAFAGLDHAALLGPVAHWNGSGAH